MRAGRCYRRELEPETPDIDRTSGSETSDIDRNSTVIDRTPADIDRSYLTMLIGIVISDIPGKRRLERRIIRLPSVLSTANGIRSRFRRPLLVLDESLE